MSKCYAVSDDINEHERLLANTPPVPKTQREYAIDLLLDKGIAEIERFAEVSRRHGCKCVGDENDCFCCAASRLAYEYRLAEHREAATKG